MMKELDTDEVYLYDGGDGDAEIYRTAEGTSFGPYVTFETEDDGFSSIVIHSPDTAARLALALLARSVSDDDEETNLRMVIAMLEGAIRVTEEERDFEIGERVEVFDASYGDLDWLSARVLEYSRHGGYLIRKDGGDVTFYSPANIRKVEQDD